MRSHPFWLASIFLADIQQLTGAASEITGVDRLVLLEWLSASHEPEQTG